MRELDWSKCPDVERDPQRVSGAWTIKGRGGRHTRIRVQDVLANFNDGLTAEEIVQDVYEGLDVEQVRRVIAFANEGSHADFARS
jgi:uncharacterized protein (DUF433 family)